ncbi:hypothetical protein UCRPC4_g02134 [Phaeomoniella chlamydospora]|uniref:Uncharacterized protein n=1 Tax=Phaeomoniella chlamydospora TaxID=158046 RepID=A0A0G2EQL4_PHACM|nr:hypothetical protein UCRPC4_g02134 [Phaeomoniella chlamydospora]
MDSMRSLNSSLPPSTPLSTKTQNPEQLLQAFKSAALSVTNLYKSAAASQSDARQQGYQDALEDLLVFLDKQNLGLMDGEGWKVRQWATERYTRGPAGLISSDDEEDNVEEDSRARESSPMRPQTQRRTPISRTSSPIRKDPPQAHVPESTSASVEPHVQSNPTPANSAMFTFTAAPPLGAPLDTDMSSSENMHENTSDTTTSNSTTTTAPVRVEMHSRGLRTSHRHGSSSRGSQKSTTREVRLNTGSKRKFPVPDFFDLSNLDNGDSKDFFGGGGKRGRFA